ncbi:hypothetical protein [Solibacillus sp. CAU 1738]|uniref:hypothetical protein n=1 Tax=Solibacillus sp. CAU 1738 TaxID=3140363 RepID=UPI003261314F
MSRSFPQRGSYVVGLSYNQLLGSTEDPPQNNGQIVSHLFFAHSYSEEEAVHYAKQGFTVFVVESGLSLNMVDFFPEIQKLRPFEIPIQTETKNSNEPDKIFPRIESKHGCKYCSVRYLKVGINATVCDMCKKHLKCTSCGRCICER